MCVCMYVCVLLQTACRILILVAPYSMQYVGYLCPTCVDFTLHNLPPTLIPFCYAAFGGEFGLKSLSFRIQCGYRNDTLLPTFVLYTFCVISLSLSPLSPSLPSLSLSPPPLYLPLSSPSLSLTARTTGSNRVSSLLSVAERRTIISKESGIRSSSR